MSALKLSKSSVLTLFTKCFHAFLEILKEQDIKIKLYYSFYINHAPPESLIEVFYDNTKEYHTDILMKNMERIKDINFFTYVTKIPELNESFMDLFRSMYVTAYQYNMIKSD